MGQLFFKKGMQEAILAGRKSTTIRRWDRPRVRVGERAFSPGLGWLMIDSVDAIELDALGDADARADGFDDLISLRDALCALYPDHAADGKQWFRIRFCLTQRAVRRRKKTSAQPGLFEAFAPGGNRDEF